MKINHIPHWTVTDRVGLGFKCMKPAVSRNTPSLAIAALTISPVSPIPKIHQFGKGKKKRK